MMLDMLQLLGAVVFFVCGYAIGWLSRDVSGR
jgi:hypothetical protein